MDSALRGGKADALIPPAKAETPIPLQSKAQVQGAEPTAIDANQTFSDTFIASAPLSVSGVQTIKYQERCL
jgi:hypothetical protein